MKNKKFGPFLGLVFLLCLLVYWLSRPEPNLPLLKLPPANKASISQLNILFGIIIRDKEQNLRFIVQNIEKLSAKFNSSSILFIENDSIDGTVDWINQHSRNRNKSNVVDISIKSFKWGGQHKDISTLANARNEILKALLDDNKYSNYDFLIQVDSDLCYIWHTDQLAQVFSDILPSYRTEWDAFFANGMRFFDEDGNGMYYDRFAYRDHQIQWNPMNGILWEVAQSSERQKLDPILLEWWDHTFINPFDCLPVQGRYQGFNCKEVNGQPLVSVTSAFGGFGVYGIDLIRRKSKTDDLCFYSSPFGDCEHVSFNQCLKERFKAKLVIASRFMVEMNDGCSGFPSQDERITKLYKQIEESSTKKDKTKLE